jgi:hypothetical protein
VTPIFESKPRAIPKFPDVASITVVPEVILPVVIAS